MISFDCMKGDLDGDGTWNLLDFQKLANCVLLDNCDERDDGGCSADVNNDGKWTAADVTLLWNCVLNDSCYGDLGNG